MGRMWVSAMSIPPQAIQLGTVQASGIETIDGLMPKFMEEVARIGGNFGKVDLVSTSFDMRTYMESYTYNCGAGGQFRQCHGMRSRTGEVATTRILGRAFRIQDLAQ
jgi:hypothetical protein